MLTGEYLTTPDAGLRTADRIRNASFIEMKEIGHFPMSENYPAFRGYLLRALELLRAKATV